MNRLQKILSYDISPAIKQNKKTPQVPSDEPNRKLQRFSVLAPIVIITYLLSCVQLHAPYIPLLIPFLFQNNTSAWVGIVELILMTVSTIGVFIAIVAAQIRIVYTIPKLRIKTAIISVLSTLFMAFIFFFLTEFNLYMSYWNSSDTSEYSDVDIDQPLFIATCVALAGTVLLYFTLLYLAYKKKLPTRK